MTCVVVGEDDGDKDVRIASMEERVFDSSIKGKKPNKNQLCLL